VSGEDAVAGVLTCRAGGWNYLQPPRRFGSCKAFDISRRTHHYPLRTLSPIFLQDWSTWQRIAGYSGASSKNAYPPDQCQLHLSNFAFSSLRVISLTTELAPLACPPHLGAKRLLTSPIAPQRREVIGILLPEHGRGDPFMPSHG
jgi:hypothetical protein